MKSIFLNSSLCCFFHIFLFSTTGGAAERTGNLKVGDVILEINGNTIDRQTRIDVWNMIKKLPYGDAVHLTLRRKWENLKHYRKCDTMQACFMYEMCSEERQKYTKKSYNNNFYYTQSIDWHTREGEGENACKIIYAECSSCNKVKNAGWKNCKVKTTFGFKRVICLKEKSTVKMVIK